MPNKRYYLTTPAYYVNDRPHLGHAYCSIAADTLARWMRLRGREVTLLTGTDEHGLKVLRAAQKRGVSPRQHADEMVPEWKALWARLGITYDDFIRTTEPRHTRVVQAVLQTLYDQGDLYAAPYEGWYSAAAERFWTEKDLVDGRCPDTGQAVEWVKEQNWFFRMSRYADRLRAHVEAHPGFIRPESRRNEVLGYLRKDIEDLCISRPMSRLPWGIPLPFAPDYVTYVWVDALVNYISAVGYRADEERFAQHWPADVHLVGKDILATHAVYWSTLLFALGLEPAHCLYAHGWWTVKGEKMSKSLGNVLDPNPLLDAWGADAVRYVLLREVTFGLDGEFSHESFLARYNADLANDFGNLAHRALSMTERWLGGRVPALDAPTADDRALEAMTADVYRRFSESFDSLQFTFALEALWELVRAGNKYIDTEEPWRLNREGRRERLGGVMRRSLEICRVAAVLLSPVCPAKSLELARKLGLDDLRLEAPDRLDGLVEGVAISAGEVLFPRQLELPAALRPPEPSRQPSEAPAARSTHASAETPLIGIEDFQKIQLRSGKVLSAQRHPSADKLLVLQVDVGEPAPRTIVAGIAARYAPEALVGQQVVVVANLKPVKLRGVESEGMLLAAGGGDVKALVTLTETLDPGNIVR